MKYEKPRSWWRGTMCWGINALNKSYSPHVHTTRHICWAARRGRNRTAQPARGNSGVQIRVALGRTAVPGWAGMKIWVGSPTARWSPILAVICAHSGPRPETGRFLWWWGRRSRTVWCCSARWAPWPQCSAASPCPGSMWGWKHPSRRGRFSQRQHRCW